MTHGEAIMLGQADHVRPPGEPPVEPLVEPLVEHYTWGGACWDIARLRAGIDQGRVTPSEAVLGRSFIEAYARQVIGLAPGATPARSGEHLSPFCRLELERLWALPDAALDAPAIILSVSPGAGVFGLPGTPAASMLLGDGHHRLARALLDGREHLRALVVNEAETAAHRVAPIALRPMGTDPSQAGVKLRRPHARRGAPLSTGRFATRAELVDKVWFLHEATSLSDEAIGRNCQVSHALVRRILMAPRPGHGSAMPGTPDLAEPAAERASSDRPRG